MLLNGKEYYSAEEFAVKQRVHLKTVYRWIKQGVAPANEAIGRMYWIEKEPADVWQKPKRGPKKDQPTKEENQP